MKVLVLAALLAFGGWKKQGSSLLLFDAEGSLISEQPTGKWDEPTGARTIVHEVQGGVSQDGRFAWTLDEQSAWNRGKTQRHEKRQIFRYYGTSTGQPLWETQAVAAPASGPPVALSRNGEIAALALRRIDDWRVEFRSFVGNTLWAVGPFPILDTIRMTGNGRFAEIRWSTPDETTTYTVIELATKKRHDIPASSLKLGKAILDEDGVVMSGGKIVFSFGK